MSCQASDELELSGREVHIASLAIILRTVQLKISRMSIYALSILLFAPGREKTYQVLRLADARTCAFTLAIPSTALVKGLQRRDAQHDAFTAGRDECKLLRGFRAAPLLLIYSIARPRLLSASKHIFLGKQH